MILRPAKMYVVMSTAALAMLCFPGRALALDLGRSPVAAVPRVTMIAADGDSVVFSHAVSSRKYVLEVNDGKRTTRLGVRPRATPFDADIGKDADGREIVVYSRCASEDGQSVDGTFPSYIEGVGCDLYRFDLKARVERRMSALSRSDASEFLPSIDRGRIAFARRYERRRGSQARIAHLFYGRLNGRELRRLPDPGPRGKADPASDIQPGPTKLDLRGGRLVYGWRVTAPVSGNPPSRFCPVPLRPDQDPNDEFLDTTQRIVQVREMKIGQRSQTVANACNLNLPSNLSSPVLNDDGSVFYLSRFDSSACSESRLTLSTSTGSLTVAITGNASPGDIAYDIAGDRSRLFVAELGDEVRIFNIKRVNLTGGSTQTPAGPAGCPATAAVGVG